MAAIGPEFQHWTFALEPIHRYLSPPSVIGGFARLPFPLSYRVQVIKVSVRSNESLEAALRRFKRQCNYSGIFRLAKARTWHEKRSDKRRRERRERLRTIQKATRKNDPNRKRRRGARRRSSSNNNGGAGGGYGNGGGGGYGGYGGGGSGYDGGATGYNL